METYFFYKTIRKTIIQFLSMFNDINIERYDINGVVKGRYRVPIRYGPKSKAFLWVKDSARDEEMLPMISVYLSGIDFDPTRLTNKYQEILVGNTNNEIGTYAKNAIPYNIGFTLNIWALHMVDIDQIFEQMLPFFAPHAFFRVRLSDLDISFDVKVVLNGCSSIMTDDVGEEEARVIKWDTTFTAQTWLFRPVIHRPLIGEIGGIGNIGGIGSVGTAGYTRTSGAGTTGFGDSGTSGKIVNRYYMDLDNFGDRDNPEREIFSDDRISEVLAFRPVGYDEETKLILDYESWIGGSGI